MDAAGLTLILDDWWEMIIAGAIILGVLLVLTRGVRDAGRAIIAYAKRHRIKAGPVELGEASADPAPTACAPYVVEHTEILGALQDAITRLTAIQEQMAREVGGIDQMQRAQNGILDVLARKAQGEQLNGEIAEARRALTKAEGYKEGAVA